VGLRPPRPLLAGGRLVGAALSLQPPPTATCGLAGEDWGALDPNASRMFGGDLGMSLPASCVLFGGDLGAEGLGWSGLCCELGPAPHARGTMSITAGPLPGSGGLACAPWWGGLGTVRYGRSRCTVEISPNLHGGGVRV